MTYENIAEYRKFLADHYDLRLVEIDGKHLMVGYPSIAADLYNDLANLHRRQVRVIELSHIPEVADRQLLEVKEIIGMNK